MEMRTVLRTVLSRVELRESSARSEGTRVHHVTLVPARGARIAVERRVEGAAAKLPRAAAAAACPHAGAAG
jgi:hypothetical protein